MASNGVALLRSPLPGLSLARRALGAAPRLVSAAGTRFRTTTAKVQEGGEERGLQKQGQGQSEVIGRGVLSPLGLGLGGLPSVGRIGQVS